VGIKTLSETSGMKKLVLHASSFNTFWAHYYVNKDEDFINRLDSLGYSLYQSDQIDMKDADFILFCEVTSIGLHRFGLFHKIKYAAKILLGRISLNSKDLYSECQKNNIKDRTALLVAEGIVSMPENHIPELGKMFPVVFTWNDKMVDNKHFLKYYIPQPVRWPEYELIPFKDKKLLVNISGNKYDSHSDELYSARRRSIRYFEKKLGDQFELYGLGWNEPATFVQRHLGHLVPFYPSYKGMAKSKTDVFPKFRFAICYENIQWPGYITEKIFDCMRSDCVPIYLGAPNINDYLPADTFIDRRKFSSEDELASFLLSIDETKYESYRISIKLFLSGSKFSPFLCTSFADALVRVLENKSDL
jgi:hypothetical protein